MNSVRALDGIGQQNAGGRLGSIGRVEFDILQSYGYIESLARVSEEPQLSIVFAVSSNPIQEASAMQNTVKGDRTTGGTLDAGFRWKRLSVQAAAYGRRAQFRRTTGAVMPRPAHQLAAGKWEVATRASAVGLHSFNHPGTRGDVTEYTPGRNRYLRAHNVKLQADYGWLDQRTFHSGRDWESRVRVQLQFSCRNSR